MTSQRLTATLGLLVCVTLTGVHFTEATILGDDGMYHGSASQPWTCSNGQVLDDVTRRCDGWKDCVDLSDEFGCESYQCPSGQWKCPTSHLCLHDVHVCDSTPDCGYGAAAEDEIQGCGVADAEAAAMYWAVMTTDSDDYDDANSYAAAFAAQVTLFYTSLDPFHSDRQTLQRIYSAAYQAALVTYTD